MGKSNFENLFYAPKGSTVAKVIKIAQLFPRLLDEEESREIMEEVSLEELKSVLHNFHKDKSPSPDVWAIEFSLGLYDILENDLLAVVE